MKHLTLLVVLMYGMAFAPLSLAADEPQPQGSQKEAKQPAEDDKKADKDAAAEKKAKKGEKKEGGGGGEEPACD